MLRTLLIIRIAVTLNVTLIPCIWYRYYGANVTLTPAHVTLTLASVTFGIYVEPATRVTLDAVRGRIGIVAFCDGLSVESVIGA
jgi:hypothetical protein